MCLREAITRVLTRIPVGFSDTGVSNDPGGRGLAVSETLNRAYVTRTTGVDPNNGFRSVVLDVIDGNTNQVIASKTLLSFVGGLPGNVAVDDSTHRIYVSANGKLFILSSDDNSTVATIPNLLTGGGLAANPVTHRVYVSGGAGFGGNNVAIVDGTSNSLVTTVSAGAVPGQIAINKKTNKIFVANTGAGSVDNSVTVINGATDSVDTIFQNTNTNNGDAVTSVAVDEATNTIYVGDNADQTELKGRVTVFDGSNGYNFVGQVGVGRYPYCLIFQTSTRQVLVGESESGVISVLGNTPLGPVPPKPAHGGLSDTVFAVNSSKFAPSDGLVSNPILQFSALQTGIPSGLNVRVQASSDYLPQSNTGTWTELPNGTGDLWPTIWRACSLF